MRRRLPLRSDTASDIHRQNVQKAKAMARMALYDGLTGKARDVYKTVAFPSFIEPDEDQICEAVERAGVYFDDEGRMCLLSEGNRSTD